MPNPPTTAIAACPTSSLRLDIGPGGAAAGTDYLPLVFTNTGPSACSLRGFPGASFVGAGGQQIGRPASRSPGEPVRRVVIAPGGKAHALLGIPDPANYSASDCRPQRASGIRVYPPDQTESLVASAHVTVCTTNNGRPLVQPIRPGMRG